MRKEFLIGGLIILIIGFAISGIIGSILLGLGLLILLYALFSKGSSRESEAKYLEYENNRTPKKETYHSPEKKSTAKYVEEPKPRYKNVDRARRELESWGSDSKGKYCPSCGSTKNPPNAKFCADCGKKI